MNVATGIRLIAAQEAYHVLRGHPTAVPSELLRDLGILAGYEEVFRPRIGGGTLLREDVMARVSSRLDDASRAAKAVLDQDGLPSEARIWLSALAV